MSYDFLLVIAIVLLSTKVLGLLSQQVHMPAVVGALLAGLLLGPSGFGLVEESEFFVMSAEIGVLILMFLAGLDTDFKQLMQTGKLSVIIALLGVLVPLGGGMAVYSLWFHDTTDPHTLLKSIFAGVILTATSVSITVETLREMGKLKTKVGTAILGAAIIDDILGVIILATITGFTDPTAKTSLIFAKLIGYFFFLAVAAVVVIYCFRWLAKHHSHQRRVAIFGAGLCFSMAYVSEEFFGIAGITGAYFAGLMLCNLVEIREYIAKKMTVVGYLFFSPMFFASIGIKTNLDGMTKELILFALVYTIVAILAKIIGCVVGSKMVGFTSPQAVCIGIGMVSRGEVALIVAQKGAQAGLLDERLFPPTILMIIVTTLLTPILLKAFVKRYDISDTSTQLLFHHHRR
ncbi:MAG: cation:proton antiporter [Eubacteriales bacterium]